MPQNPISIRHFSPQIMNEKILVGEDEPALQDTLAYNLINAGYQVTVAGDGQLALELARKELPVLIILDIMLPYIDGLEVCRLLRQEMKTPILICLCKPPIHASA